MKAPDDKNPAPGDQPSFEGPDRRSAETADRRREPRGGRRVGDAFKRLADFAYRLLTEPPR